MNKESFTTSSLLLKRCVFASDFLGSFPEIRLIFAKIRNDSLHHFCVVEGIEYPLISASFVLFGGQCHRNLVVCATDLWLSVSVLHENVYRPTSHTNAGKGKYFG